MRHSRPVILEARSVDRGGMGSYEVLIWQCHSEPFVTQDLFQEGIAYIVLLYIAFIYNICFVFNFFINYPYKRSLNEKIIFCGIAYHCPCCLWRR